MNSRLLRSLTQIVLFDAATCAIMGLALVFAATFIEAMTNIPGAVLTYAGLALFPVAAFMAYVARQATPSDAGMVVIVVGNVAWVAGSVALLAGLWSELTLLGQLFITAQAAAVALIAFLEHRAWQHTRLAVAAR